MKKPRDDGSGSEEREAQQVRALWIGKTDSALDAICSRIIRLVIAPSAVSRRRQSARTGRIRVLPACRQPLLGRSVHATRSLREARERTTSRELHPQSVLESYQALVATLGVREPLAPIRNSVRAARRECARPRRQERLRYDRTR